MTILRAELAQRVFDTPLMMHEGKAMAALIGIGGRIVEGGVSFEGDIQPIDHVAFENGRPSMGRLGDRLGRSYDKAGQMPFDVVDGVAVLGVEGTLVHKGKFVGMSSGRTSYEGLQTQIARVAKNDAIRGAVFEVDSFGGEAAGAFETASAIRRLSALKPTLAILTDHALSSGYLMASAARQIVMPEHGKAGSIGVIRLHTDVSGALEKKGVKITVLHAGDRKADGHPFAALPDDVANGMRAELQATRKSFANAVGLGRGSRLTPDAALATEAGSYSGADAVRLGLADAVGEPGAAFDAFISAVNRAGRPF